MQMWGHCDRSKKFSFLSANYGTGVKLVQRRNKVSENELNIFCLISETSGVASSLARPPAKTVGLPSLLNLNWLKTKISYFDGPP